MNSKVIENDHLDLHHEPICIMQVFGAQSFHSECSVFKKQILI